VLSGEQRRVAHDVLPLFVSLQARLAAAPPEEWWQHVLPYSRQVSAVLCAGAEAARFGGGASAFASASGLLPPADGARDTLALNRAAWELLSACFVEQGRDGRSVAQSLVAWLARNADAATDSDACAGPVLRRVVAAAASAARPEEVPGFWAAAAQATALGDYGAAASLLSLHSVWADWRLGKPSAAPLVDVLDAAKALLTAEARAPPGTPAAQLAAWRQRQAADLLGAGEVWARVAGSATGEGVRTLLRALAGDEPVLYAACANWIELTAALLQHVHVGAHAPRELMRVADAARARKPPAPTPAPTPTGAQPRRAPLLDSLLPAALARDAATCVLLCSERLDVWFCAHAADLMAASGSEARALLCEPQQGGAEGHAVGRTIMQRYRLEYAAAASSCAGMTHVAAAYCASAGTHGAAALRQLLARAAAPGDDDTRRTQLLAVAWRHGMHEEARQLCVAAGVAAEAAGEHAAAAAWLARAGDAAGLDRLAARKLPPQPWRAPEPDRGALALLDAACAEGDASREEEGEGALAYLNGMRRMREHTAAAQLAGQEAAHDPVGAAAAVAEQEGAAAGVLRALLSADAVPRSRWPALLFAAVPLLEALHGATRLEGGLGELLCARLAELHAHAWGGADAWTAPHDGHARAQLEAVRLALARHAAAAAAR
jgi:hypothetical protein